MDSDQQHEKPTEKQTEIDPNELRTNKGRDRSGDSSFDRRKLIQAAIGGTVALGLAGRSSEGLAMTNGVPGWNEIKKDDEDSIFDNAIKWIRETLPNFYNNSTKDKWRLHIEKNCLRAYWRRYDDDDKKAIVVVFHRRRRSTKPESWYLSFGFSGPDYDTLEVLEDVNQLCLKVVLPVGEGGEGEPKWPKKIGRRTDLTEEAIIVSRLGKLFTAADDANLIREEDEDVTPAFYLKGKLVWPAVYERLVVPSANYP